ncbi:hypothetical protein K2X33_03865 [bacterium]|nr:hypothetical protein [bacterium]
MKAAFLALCFTTLAVANSGHHEPVKMPKAFGLLENLVGTWEGTYKGHDGKEEKSEVVYKLTSAGTALLETLAPGGPMEMTSVYHKTGDTLEMTHYCALGNSPQMELKNADTTSIAFEMKKPRGVASLKEDHMHAVTLKMPDKNTLVQEWVSYQGGKPGEKVVFNFHRK